MFLLKESNQQESQMNNSESHKLGILLWDIDGTLIKTKRPVPSVHIQAIRTLGFYINEITSSHQGLTDYEVIKQILNDNRISPTEEQIARIFSALDEAHQLNFNTGDRELCKGIKRKFLSTLGSEWSLGVITGNTELRAKSKLSSFNLLDLFEPECIFTSRFGETREHIATRAKRKCLELAQTGGELKIIIIGDTPADVAAAQAVNLPIITVASGKFSYAVLNATNPNMTIRNFKVDLRDFNSMLSKA
jgi:phosphoglycolate phosphatase-like HAD superfamily hydrolase